MEPFEVTQQDEGMVVSTWDVCALVFTGRGVSIYDVDGPQVEPAFSMSWGFDCDGVEDAFVESEHGESRLYMSALVDGGTLSVEVKRSDDDIGFIIDVFEDDECMFTYPIWDFDIGVDSED